MEKLPMCRICLAEDVRMYVVVNRDLHKLYEKLTDTPFVTKDIRPIIACFFCCAKLKKCYKFLRQCLKAEELFIQRMNEDYAPDPQMKQNHLEFFNGFINSQILHMSIVEECQTGDIALKEDLPDVCEGLEDIIEPLEERQSDELEPDVDNNCLGVADIASHHSESDFEVDVVTLKTEQEEQEVYRKKRRAGGTKLEPDVDNNCLGVADITSHHSESDFEVDVVTVQTEQEGQEVYRKIRRARGTTKEETDVVSVSTQLPLPTTQTHVRTDSLPRVPSAQERQHIQRTVETAITPRSLRPAARQRPVPPPSTAAASRRRARGPARRGRRSHTDTDSEAELLEIERRSIHNDTERLRCKGLRNLFAELKKQIPATRDKERAPKVVIVKEAVALCRKLSQEDLEREKLKKKQHQLVTKLKKLRTMVSARYRSY